MNRVDSLTYYSAIEDWAVVPYRQYSGWVKAQLTNPREVIYLLADDIASVGYVKRKLGFSWLMLDTPALRTADINPRTFREFYRELTSLGYDAVEVTDDAIYDPYREVAFRQAGYLRPVGSFSYALTSIIDLNNITYDQNWKRNLKKAHDDMRVNYVPAPANDDVSKAFALYETMCSQKHLPVPFSKEYLHVLLDDGRFRLYFCGNDDVYPLSMMIVHTEYPHAGLLYAATTHLALHYNAGFVMYRDVLSDLRTDCFDTFDMEKMGASTHSTNAVYLFKQGVRGTLAPLSGEWTWYSSPRIRWMMYFVKRCLLKKREA